MTSSPKAGAVKGGGLKASQDAQKIALCAICKNPQVKAYAPFCSKRCADVDLHRWLSGGYAIPAVESADEEDYSDQGM